ncbi:hypothetical protein [Saccharibacillus qingshengii]|uniref:hypothetical protein n=1 Tax=Saccharibacillus qingshengii TaxID=1763540 RepID=UPI001555E6D9|nr:hypothetical protein [Saccharibacillus qingshengii]
MNRTAWILNLHEPFGAALGRELMSRGWNVIGGDPTGLDTQEGRSAVAKNGSEGDLPELRAADDGWGSTIAPESVSLPVPGSDLTDEEERPSGVHIGENRDIPTGTGSSGLEDFEGSVAFGPESNARPKAGETDPAYAEETEAPSHGADPNASNEAGAFVRAEPEDGDSDRTGGSAAASSEVRTSDAAGRIDLLVLNAGEMAPEFGQPSSRSVEGKADESSVPGGWPAGSAGQEDTPARRLQDYETYALTPLRAVERLLPRMNAEDGLKRICFISSREGSISVGEAHTPIGRAMAHTALHMQAKLLFNDLRREGYTFRLYDPGLRPKLAGGSKPQTASSASDSPMTPLSAPIAESARFAAGLFANPHANEDRLVLTGGRGEEWPF